jgi:integrase
MKSQVLTLTLSQVDLSAGTLRINPSGSKTGEGRVVYLSAEVRMLVEEQLERVRTLFRAQCPLPA